MDFGFPEPYDLEVPRRIGEARQQLSPEGEEVLERIITATGSPEDVYGAIKALPQREIDILLAVNNFLVEANEAQARALRGWGDLHLQMVRLIERAQELEPSLGDDATTREAVEVLRRHGEPLGISDEVLEMIIWVPREE
jgi:hypothetical protein